ncbi:TetR/AcrR family transcriptional regulator [Rhodanobacter glycinis]|uniref:TetR/AcrR family transcriptional regulator n=1 Tax=Rhodanobacter glycinis TaxID=582702 RepID=UPI0013760A8E|nr:TetR/AcrR family transcriptional regulator [Rhodanobacter glycinis]
MAAHEDRRIQRTRQLLRGSLLALVREKGFEAVSVQEIADRANVGRSTFYAHYSDKEELLLHGFDELRALLRQRQREARSRPGERSAQLFGFSRELFEHVGHHRDVFHAMVGKRSGAAVQQRLQNLVIDLVRDDVKLALPPSRAKATQREPLVRFIAGALFGLLAWWLDEQPNLSPDDMDRSFRQLAAPALDAAAPM